MQRARTISVFALFFLAVSLSFAQKVEVDFNHDVDFAKYRTFMWIKKPVTTEDPFMAQRIVDSVNLQLISKGIQLVQSNADLGVSVNVATQERHTLNTFYDGFGGWAWGMDGAATTAVETYDV